MNDIEMIIHESTIDSAIFDACQEIGIEDLEKESQRRFKAVLMLVGKRLFPDRSFWRDRSLYNNNSITLTTSNRYDYEKLYILLDYYIYISNKYSKLISIEGFSYLANIDRFNIENWKSAELTSTAYSIWKKLYYSRLDCVKDKGYDSNNPTGAIYIGNTEYATVDEIKEQRVLLSQDRYKRMISHESDNICLPDTDTDTDQ